MPIRPRHLILPLLLALPFCCISIHAQQANDLQQRMSSDEFKAAGLDKLSPQELANLDNWLNSHGKVTTKVVDSSGNPVFYTAKSERSKINAHIVGHFAGWHGHDQFTLDNGQIWKQVGSDAPSCANSDNPAAKVKPSIMGDWLMYVDGCNDSVHVERVR
ncbi:hypothetical protein B0E46_08250 [Rhodanobacter sp. B04]|uniref:hypothetical protein n=1 Tax=Rhodanobacter sp. B04 TaxID=1945860 RepID=UPI00098597E8|nr:hypothetical protein [Rhodanobacter sp. B04]OOG63922.1 hypothetical protein B0E46_08250 [Rhodanobacter sp. B04]